MTWVISDGMTLDSDSLFKNLCNELRVKNHDIILVHSLYTTKHQSQYVCNSFQVQGALFANFFLPLIWGFVKSVSPLFREGRAERNGDDGEEEVGRGDHEGAEAEQALVAVSIVLWEEATSFISSHIYRVSHQLPHLGHTSFTVSQRRKRSYSFPSQS